MVVACFAGIADMFREQADTTYSQRRNDDVALTSDGVCKVESSRRVISRRGRVSIEHRGSEPE